MKYLMRTLILILIILHMNLNNHMITGLKILAFRFSEKHLKNIMSKSILNHILNPIQEK